MPSAGSGGAAAAGRHARFGAARRTTTDVACYPGRVVGPAASPCSYHHVAAWQYSLLPVPRSLGFHRDCSGICGRQDRCPLEGREPSPAPIGRRGGAATRPPQAPGPSPAGARGDACVGGTGRSRHRGLSAPADALEARDGGPMADSRQSPAAESGGRVRPQSGYRPQVPRPSGPAARGTVRRGPQVREQMLARGSQQYDGEEGTAAGLQVPVRGPASRTARGSRGQRVGGPSGRSRAGAQASGASGAAWAARQLGVGVA